MTPRCREPFRKSHAIAVQQMLYSGLVASELLLYGFSEPHHWPGIDIVTLMDINAGEQAALEWPYKFGGIHLVRFHRFLILGCGYIRRMYDNAVNADILQRIVGRKSAETGFVNGMVFTVRIILLQKVKELSCRGFLRMSLYHSDFGGYRNSPWIFMDIDSDKNLLSFERNFFSLHIGT